jgi:hypothetical protein
MNRLQAEWQRLFQRPAEIDPASSHLRAAVLELARPADWEALGRIWHGVQADLQMPAPAIAINGSDGYQLWFSFAEPVAAAQATGFLESLRSRYLGEITRTRIGITPLTGGSHNALEMPPQQTLDGQWSAFVAPDLAPVFADEPWLDMPPNPDGQADLLCRLQSIKIADLSRVFDGSGSAEPAVPGPAVPGASLDPRVFLLRVMNDETVAMALRIEAAKALLPGQL